MPPSLHAGQSRIIPIKCDEKLRQQLRDCLAAGEDISSLTRELWRKEIANRTPKKKAKKLSGK